MTNYTALISPQVNAVKLNAAQVNQVVVIGGGGAVPIVAGEDLALYKVVRTGGLLANSSIQSHANTILGVITEAALSGETAEFQDAGAIIDATWAWTVGLPIFFDVLGNLTQVVPTAGFTQQVAMAITTQQILINVQPAILIQT